MVTDLASSDGVTYAVVTNCPSGSCEQGATLYRTDASTDGWHAVDGVSLPAEGGQIELQARAAWFVGPATEDGGGATFLASPDGTTWAQHDDPCVDDDAVLDGVAPVDTTRVFLLCVNDPGAGSQGKSVRLSTDAGATSAPPAPRTEAASRRTSPPPTPRRSRCTRPVGGELHLPIDRRGQLVDDRRPPLRRRSRLPRPRLHHRDPGRGHLRRVRPTASPPSTSRLLMTHDAGATWTALTID